VTGFGDRGSLCGRVGGFGLMIPCDFGAGGEQDATMMSGSGLFSHAAGKAFLLPGAFLFNVLSTSSSSYLTSGLR
jgi:hypothetical protein